MRMKRGRRVIVVSTKRRSTSWRAAQMMPEIREEMGREFAETLLALDGEAAMLLAMTTATHTIKKALKAKPGGSG